MKKMDKKEEEVKEEKAEKVLPVREPVTISETQPVEEVKDVTRKSKTPKKAKELTEEEKTREKVTTTTKTLTRILREATESTEVEDILQTVKGKEFGPGDEKPLKELAQIGFMVKKGVSVSEIQELYNLEKFPELRKPESQSALVQVVERKGHSPIITEVLTQETAIDETTASTIGFKAFMRMIELNYATVEEVLTNLAPEDFKPESWTFTRAIQVNFFFFPSLSLFFSFSLFPLK